MANAPSFGRRTRVQRAEQNRRVVAREALNTARAEQIVLTPAEPAPPSDIDRELAEWKRARGVRVPWRQISLIASLSFGIAYFVLPDSVNDAVGWVLVALSIASFVNGVVPRGKK